MQRTAVWIICIFVGCVSALAKENGKPTASLTWSELPQSPAAAGVPAGLRGALVGVHNNALILAGGSTVDDKVEDRIFVLVKGVNGQYQWWAEEQIRLARPLSHGVAVSTDSGVVCIGGFDGIHASAEVFRLQWDPQSEKVANVALPSLPKPLSHMAGALIGNTIYVAGGQGEEPEAKNAEQAREEEGCSFLALDLSEPDKGWRRLCSWPGPGRILPAAATQHDGTGVCFYIFGGHPLAEQEASTILNDAYKYNPATGAWRKLADLVVSDGTRLGLSAADSAIGYGDSHVFVIRGTERSECTDVGGEVIAYHTITDTWVQWSRLPGGLHAPCTVWWQDKIVLTGFEFEPEGPSQCRLYTIAVQPGKRSLGMLNTAVLTLYLMALVVMGFYFSRREKTTGDYFLGGRRVPWWAVGLSIFGTQLSSISFMAIPAKVYSTDWLYYMTLFCIVAVQPIVVYFYLPFFRRLNVTTAYEYLEKRFNVAARLFGSLSFILFQCGRMTIVLFLPSLALSAVTGVNIYACILIMGILATLYTVLGGIEAVIWTDVLQLGVLFGGALLSLGIIVYQIGGVGRIFEIGHAAGKFQLVEWGWDWTVPVLWVIIIGNLFSNMMSYTADQAVIQRYLTTRDEKAAARAIWVNAAVTIPIGTIWFLLGTSLYTFYKLHPAALDPTLSNDQIFPLFIAQQLPNGVVGIVIAGLFAAAMSTVDSSLNSISTTITTDFYRRFKRNASDHAALNLARMLTVAFGVAATVTVLWMAANQGAIKSLWDTYLKVLGLVMGSLTGLFVLGIFSRRAHGIGALVGAVGGVVLVWAVQEYTKMHFFLYATVGITGCFVIGYLASVLLPLRRKSVEGLTIYTLAEATGRADA